MMYVCTSMYVIIMLVNYVMLCYLLYIYDILYNTRIKHTYYK